MEDAGIRSLLFVPGDKPALATKAMASQADAVILDLEDAVAPDNKVAARAAVRGMLDEADRAGKTVLVRINALDTGLAAEDIASVVGGRPWGVVLPKAHGRADLERLDHWLEALEAREGLPLGRIRVLAIVTETAASTLALGAPSDSAVPTRLWGLMWGSEDLAVSLGSADNRESDGSYSFPYRLARAQCLYAAAALGVIAVDAVHTAFRDLDALALETRIGARDGFAAKAAIHPAQAPVINEALTPTAEAIGQAHRIVEALAGRAVAPLDGRMVDLAHLRLAERTIARAAAHGGAPNQDGPDQ